MTTGGDSPAKDAVGIAIVTHTDESSLTKDTIGTAMLSCMDTELVLKVSLSMVKNVCRMGTQSSKFIDRLTGKQTPTRQAKATVKGKAPAAYLPPLPPAISLIIVPSEVPSKAGNMWAKLICNDISFS